MSHKLYLNFKNRSLNLFIALSKAIKYHFQFHLLLLLLFKNYSKLVIFTFLDNFKVKAERILKLHKSYLYNIKLQLNFIKKFCEFILHKQYLNTAI